ncbi:MAG: hypothetical protein KAY24_04155 [Candidatus Eisenbacteria sp.]|nr:hypothetical protein [Candidatus Eisenbacteria bacterium]
MRQTPVSVALIALSCIAGLGAATTTRALEIVINGQDNAIFGGEYVHLTLADGTTALEISVSGTANYAPGNPFAGILTVRHSQPDNLSHCFIPEGGSLVLDDLRPGNGAIDFFFVDEDPTDNAGSYLVSVTPNVGPPFEAFSVSAADHCIDVSRAVTGVLPPGCLTASATGDAWWAHYGYPPDSGHYSDLVIMYDDTSTPQQRTFAVVGIEGDIVELPQYAGGTVWAFLTDVSGIIFDNGGDVVLTVESAPTPVQSVSRGLLKHLLR